MFLIFLLIFMVTATRMTLKSSQVTLGRPWINLGSTPDRQANIAKRITPFVPLSPGRRQKNKSLKTPLKWQAAKKCYPPNLPGTRQKYFKVFLFFINTHIFAASQASGGCLRASPCFCGSNGVRMSFWDGLELEL